MAQAQYSPNEKYEEHILNLNQKTLIPAFSYGISTDILITEPVFDCVVSTILGSDNAALVHSNREKTNNDLEIAINQIADPIGAVIIGGDPLLLMEHIGIIYLTQIPIKGVYCDFWSTRSEGSFFSGRKEIILNPEERKVTLYTPTRMIQYQL